MRDFFLKTLNKNLSKPSVEQQCIHMLPICLFTTTRKKLFTNIFLLTQTF